eukprot:8583243-Karenia_brevis.AAC.1
MAGGELVGIAGASIMERASPKSSSSSSSFWSRLEIFLVLLADHFNFALALNVVVWGSFLII